MEFGEIGSQLESLLREEATRFVQNNAVDVAALGEETVRAILAQPAIDQVAAIPVLGPDASLDARVYLEEILAQRSRVLQLVAKAEREDAERVARIRKNGLMTVQKIGIAAGSIAAGAAVNALLKK